MWTQRAVSDEERLGRAETTAVLRRSLRLARPHHRTITLATAYVVASTMVALAGPTIVRHAIDHGIATGDTATLNRSVVLYLAVAAAGYVVARKQHLAINRAGEGFLRDLRVVVFDRLQAKSMSFFDRHKAGVLVSRMTADVESMGELIQWGLLQLVSSGLLLVLSFVLLAVLSWQLMLVALLAVPVLAAASVRFQRVSNRAYLTVRDRVGQNLSTLQEGLTGVRVVQACAQEDAEQHRFIASNRALYDAHLHSVRVSAWYFGLVELTGIATTGAIVGVGGWLVHRGEVTVGTVAAFVLLLANLFDPVQQLSQLYNTVQSAAAALHKLYALIDEQPDVRERPDPVDLPPTGEIRVDRVWFTYPGADRPALADVSLQVAPGERVALVGPTGAGKSTLAKLVARLYDPTHGTVTFGGVDLRDASFASLRQRIVVVPQEGFLFSGTIRDNVRLARATATDDEVEAALASIGALDHFQGFPDGLGTEVRERGARLSAGERQLVALARAALVDPAVLVLDEATSNLDPGTERTVQHALEQLMQGRTVIVVAHRLSTVRRADRIAVVDHGELVEVGSHAELIERGGRYAALVDAWARAQPAAGR